MEYYIRKIKTLFRSSNFRRSLIAIVIGGAAGFLYYFITQCEGTFCSFTGQIYGSMVWGGLLGLFLVNSPCFRGRC